MTSSDRNQKTQAKSKASQSKQSADGLFLDWPATDDEMQVASTITRSRSPKLRKFGAAKFSKISSISNYKLNASTVSIAIEEVEANSIGAK